jgi:sigma-B regulation protein RsbU (phosphoserine phosphatase)
VSDSPFEQPGWASEPEPQAQPAGKEDTFSHLRHELRTPLNHILGYSEMLQEDAEAAGQKNIIPDLQKIHRAAENLLATINTHLGKPPKEETKFFQDTIPEKIAGETIFITKIKKAKEEAATAKITGHLLVVDDNESNRDVLARRLEKQGFTVATANDGREVLQRLRVESYDLVLLDIMMPELDGFTVLQIIKADPRIRHIPIIMISALDEMEAVVRCIEAGAEDFLPKPFNATLLRARIGACLEKKYLRDQEQRTYQALVESQKHLAAELAEAADYVKTLLPPPLNGEIKAEWRFIPSTELGGDAFGYHWVDSDHFAMYLLDVCGHGVGAALLSISVMNVLRSQSLAVDFRIPGLVLGALNEAFQMDNHNDMYFTIWYGVFDKNSRQLTFSVGGHPPAVLVSNGTALPLRTQGVIIGSLPTVDFPSAQCHIPAGSRLFIFSDGAYEITRKDGTMLQLEEFVAHLATSSGLDNTVAFTKEVNNEPIFADDFSIVQIQL